MSTTPSPTSSGDIVDATTREIYEQVSKDLSSEEKKNLDHLLSRTYAAGALEFHSWTSGRNSWSWEANAHFGPWLKNTWKTSGEKHGDEWY